MLLHPRQRPRSPLFASPDSSQLLSVSGVSCGPPKPRARAKFYSAGAAAAFFEPLRKTINEFNKTRFGAHLKQATNLGYLADNRSQDQTSSYVSRVERRVDDSGVRLLSEFGVFEIAIAATNRERHCSAVCFSPARICSFFFALRG